MKTASEYTESVVPSPEINSSPSAVEPRTLTLAAIEAAIGQRGQDVRGLEMLRLTDIADYFVIVSGTSDRHVKGIADKIRAALREYAELPLSVSGYETGEWIVVDYGDLIVHVFLEPVRQYYRFDELWSPAPQLQLPEKLATEARKLRTGMISA